MENRRQGRLDDLLLGDTLALNNPREVWWGEGDEKIYFDGQKFPSHFGTGTEDYYGYAWCTPEFFESPFHCQPRDEGPQNKGHVTNTRGRLLDGIPFTKDFRFDMEVWHWRPVNVAYAATTYWYGRPGAKGNYGPMPEMARVIVAEGPKPRKVEGAIDYGIVRLYLDHEPLGEPIDWINQGVVSEVYSLGNHQLTAGTHRLTAEITGANPKAVKRHMFGLDYLKLEPVE